MFFLPRKSATGIYLATSPEVEGISGRFFVGKKPAGFTPAWDLVGTASQLWTASEGLAGLGGIKGTST
jgi:hypothetical protein